MSKITVRTAKVQIKKAGLDINDFTVWNDGRIIVAMANGACFSLLEMRKMHRNSLFAKKMLTRKRKAIAQVETLIQQLVTQGFTCEDTSAAIVHIVR